MPNDVIDLVNAIFPLWDILIWRSFLLCLKVFSAKIIWKERKSRKRVESYLKTVGLHKDFSGHNGYKFYNKGFSCHDFITRTSKAVMDSGFYFDCVKLEKIVIIYNLYFYQTQKLNQILIFIFTISALKKIKILSLEYLRRLNLEVWHSPNHRRRRRLRHARHLVHFIFEDRLRADRVVGTRQRSSKPIERLITIYQDVMPKLMLCD